MRWKTYPAKHMVFPSNPATVRKALYTTRRGSHAAGQAACIRPLYLPRPTIILQTQRAIAKPAALLLLLITACTTRLASAAPRARLALSLFYCSLVHFISWPTCTAGMRALSLLAMADCVWMCTNNLRRKPLCLLSRDRFRRKLIITGRAPDSTLGVKLGAAFNERRSLNLHM